MDIIDEFFSRWQNLAAGIGGNRTEFYLPVQGLHFNDLQTDPATGNRKHVTVGGDNA